MENTDLKLLNNFINYLNDSIKILNEKSEEKNLNSISEIEFKKIKSDFIKTCSGEQVLIPSTLELTEDQKKVIEILNRKAFEVSSSKEEEIEIKENNLN
jgi:hypothetical protein